MNVLPFRIIGLHRIDVLNSFRTIFRETDIKFRDEANPDPTQKKKNEQEGKSGKKVQKLIVLSNCLLIHLRIGTFSSRLWTFSC